MKSIHSRNRSASPKPAKKYAAIVSLQRRKFLSEWIKFIVPLHENSIIEESIKTGVIPYKILQNYRQNFSLRGFQQSPNQSQAYNNMLLINNFLFQEFPNSEIPSPSDMLKKGSTDHWTLINTIFKNFQMNEVKKNWGKCVEWYSSILKLYGIAVHKDSFVKDCLNGVFLACILNCYAGFKLVNIYRNPSPLDVTKNLSLIFEALKGKILISPLPTDFSNNTDEDFTSLLIFSVFKIFRFEVPNLPTRDKLQFKSKPQLTLNTTESLISLSSMGSLEYSTTTILSKDPSELNLAAHTTPKWTREKAQELITDDSTGYSMQPYEISYEAVSVANSSYTQKTNDRLSKLEKANAKCEREMMFVADLRTKKERLAEVPSLKKLRNEFKASEGDFLCFLITPRVLKMIKPVADNFIVAVVMNLEVFSARNESYSIEWKDFSLVVRGKVSLGDIHSCESSGRILEIKALNNEWVLQCLNEKEAMLYAFGINKIIKPKSLFSRDVSCNELILNIH